MRLVIKNMVTNRCKLAVIEVFKKLNLHAVLIDLGEVDVIEEISFDQKTQLKSNLLQLGFELLEDRKEAMVERIKIAIIDAVHHSEGLSKFKFSVFLSRKLNYDYTYLANIFSALEDNTIEQFIIAHKVERVKELILYGECNLTEIAWKMNYSSVAHLSNQFKKFTGLSPSSFKQLRHQKRNPLEEIGNIYCVTQTSHQYSQATINFNPARTIRN